MRCVAKRLNASVLCRFTISLSRECGNVMSLSVAVCLFRCVSLPRERFAGFFTLVSSSITMLIGATSPSSNAYATRSQHSTSHKVKSADQLVTTPAPRHSSTGAHTPSHTLDANTPTYLGEYVIDRIADDGLAEDGATTSCSMVWIPRKR